MRMQTRPDPAAPRPVLVRYPHVPGWTRTLTLLSRKLAPVADTICDCGGLLAYVAARWQHVDQCLSCRISSRPCGGQHITCTSPTPRRCLHRGCNEPVTLTEQCALDRAVHECDGCCWNLDDTDVGD